MYFDAIGILILKQANILECENDEPLSQSHN